MNRLSVIAFVFMFLSGWLFCDELSSYAITKIKDIPVGQKEGLIGWEPPIAGGYSGPTSFAITDNEEIYVPDRVNYRINVYDIRFNYIRTIIEKGEQYAHYALNLKVDSKGNMYYCFSDLGLTKIDNTGYPIYTVNPGRLPKEVKFRDNFFPIDDEVFIYNDQDEVEYINNSGETVKGANALKRLQELSSKNENQLFTTLRNSGHYLLIYDNFYSSVFRKNREYFEKVQAIRKFAQALSDKASGDKKVSINPDNFSLFLIGYDKEHNSYWEGIQKRINNVRNYAVIVYSKYGALLDAFYYGQDHGYEPNLELYPTTMAEIAIAPSGDVYFLVGNKTTYSLYRVKRQW